MTTPSRPLFAFNPYLPLLASSYISPASVLPQDLAFSWQSMPPQNKSNARTTKKKPRSPAVTAKKEELPSNGGFTFITGEKPDDFKSRETMTKVRKQAMAAWLEGGGKTITNSRSPGNRSRPNSVESASRVSEQTRSSVDHDDGNFEASTGPATASEQLNSTRSSRKSPSSNTSAESDKNQQLSYSKAITTKPQKSRDFVLPAAPIVIPIRPGPRPYDTHTPPPFESLGKSLDPFQTMFQAQHPSVSVEDLKFRCSHYFGTRSLGEHWIPAALGYSHTFLSTLCLATAYNDVICGLPLDSVQTVALRQEVIHLVGRNIRNLEESISDHNIQAVIQLIISMVIGREESSLRWHENGLKIMIEQRGGLKQLGIHGRLASAITWVSLAIAVLREEQPQTMYLDYGTATSTKHYSPTATIPESPIYCPRSTFKTIQRSPGCTLKAQELLGDIRMIIDIFLHETKSTRRNSQTLMNLYKKITSTEEYPTAAQLRNSQVLTTNDWRYEAIRIVSVIQATAIIRRLPLSEALSHAAELRVDTTVPSASTSQAISTSPFEMNQYTELSTSPSFSTFSTSPAFAGSYFPKISPRSSTSSFKTNRPSFSSAFSAPRPSLSSTHSTSSDFLFFAPPPSAPTASNNATALLQDLHTAIEYSNVSECWSDMAGVLLWVCLTAAAASKSSDSKVLKKYFSALTMRAGIILCFEHPEAINATMLQMCEIVKALGAAKKVDKGAEGKAKKRRV